MAILSIQNISKSYGKNKVLNDVSLDVNKGDIYGILGLSGAGKSTLVRCINGLETFDEGSIYFNDELLCSNKVRISKNNRRKIGMIFQGFNLLEQRDVLGNVMLGLEIAKEKDIKEKALDALKKVGLEDKAHYYPSQLSGGQKQRVAIARVLALNPEIILSDEATSALDPETTHSVLELLKKLNEELGLTIIMISHQIEVVEAICNKVAIINKAKIVEKGELTDIFLRPQEDITKRFVYTNKVKDMLESNKVIQLLFSGNLDKPVIANIIKDCNILISIIHADTKVINNKMYGHILIKRPDNEEDVLKLKKYLSDEKINFVEVND